MPGRERADTVGPVLVAAFLFNLGQGVLRPTLPLYMNAVFAANYRMVTAIPTAFGLGKWIASLPTAYLAHRFGRRALMVAGLALIAGVDLASASTAAFATFLTLRGLGGVGWAMFGTLATTTVVDRDRRRGRAVSLLLMSETLGLLLGNAAGGWLYQMVGLATPFVFEASCMALAAIVIAGWISAPSPAVAASRADASRPRLGAALRTPGIPLMGLVNGALMAVQTGVLVFLVPLFLSDRARLAPAPIGVLVSLSTLGRLPGLWWGGTLADRWGRARALAPGLLAMAALLAAFTFLRHPAALALWSLASGGATGFVAPLPTALVGDLAPPELLGVCVGWLRTVTDMGHVLGPLGMGALADGVDRQAPFFGAAVMLALLAWRCHRDAAIGTRG